MAQLAVPLRGHLEQSSVVQSGGGGREVGSGQGIMRWGVGQGQESWRFHGLWRGTTRCLPEPQFFHLLSGNNNVMHRVLWELIR